MASLLKGLLGSQSADSQPTGAEIIQKLKNRYANYLILCSGYCHTHLLVSLRSVSSNGFLTPLQPIGALIVLISACYPCRVTSSTLLEDRRDAVRTIKALSKKYQSEVGTQCLEILINVIKNDRMDGEIVGYAVEALWNVMTSQVGGEDSETSSLGIQFTEEFIKNPENLTMLLNLLEDFDFHVRRPTTCLITTLLMNKLAAVQEAVLVSPMGISRIMDLLSDSREVIRNDALLLLLQLSRSNPQIQKIIAFENAFDRLLSIIREEGLSDGGIIVEDCLSVMQNLLLGNNSNQAFFREASLIQNLVPFFDFKLPQGSSESSWSPQKVSNVFHMLKLIRSLVSHKNPQQATASCQRVMNQCGLLKHLCGFMFASGVPTEILVVTISTVAEVIRGCEANQQYFETVVTPSTPPRSAILALLMSMVAEKQPLMLRLTALYCFQCYVYNNPKGQSDIINTLLPSQSETSVSAGQVLCAGLFGQDPLSNWCTAIALSNALNPSLKPQLLRVQLSLQGKGQVTLLQQITTILAERTDLKVQTRIGLMVLLCVWLADSTLAVVQFLNDAGNIPFLTGQLEQHYSTELEQLFRSLCAVLLGICLAYHDGSDTQYPPDTLRQIIVHRIGQDAFSECLRHVSSSELFTHAAKSPHLYADSLEMICFDYHFTVFFKKTSDVITKSLDPSFTAPTTAPPQQNGLETSANVSTSIEDHDSIVASYKELIRDQDGELTSLQEKYAVLEKQHAQDAATLQQQMVEIHTLKQQVSFYADLKEKDIEGENGEVAKLQSTIISLQRLQESQRQEIAGKDVQIEQLQRDLEVARGTPQQSDMTADKVTKLQEEIEQLRAENEALLTEKDVLDEQLKSLQDQQKPIATDSGAESSATSAQVTQLQQQLKQLEIAYRELQKSHEATEKEQDDLLVLLANHDQKEKKYRSLLLEHNVEIPEDEEGSDFEEESEEEVD